MKFSFSIVFSFIDFAVSDFSLVLLRVSLGVETDALVIVSEHAHTNFSTTNFFIHYD